MAMNPANRRLRARDDMPSAGSGSRSGAGFNPASGPASASSFCTVWYTSGMVRIRLRLACVRGEENFEVNVRESVIHKDHHQHALRFVDSGVYVDGVALRVYARTPCLFVNVREWRGGVVTGHALVIRINGLNRSNSGSPTTPASARKRCNAGE